MEGVVDAFGFNPDSAIGKALTVGALPERKIFFGFGIWQLVVKDLVNYGFAWNPKIRDCGIGHPKRIHSLPV